MLAESGTTAVRTAGTAHQEIAKQGVILHKSLEVDEYLVKPIKPEKLHEVALKCLQPVSRI
jgi:hypothetical protein